MSDTNQLPERIFLTQLIVEEHNHQTGSKHDWQKMSIYSIDPIPGFQYGYEVDPIFEKDSLRIQFYFNKGVEDSLGRCRIEFKPHHQPNKPHGEVFVYRGELDTAHTFYDGYKLLWMGKDPNSFPYILQTDRQPFTLVGGEYLSLV